MASVGQVPIDEREQTPLRLLRQKKKMEQEEAAAPWADLIHEVLVQVLRRLDFEDLFLSVPLVCKSWRTASLDPACWERVNIESCFLKRIEVAHWWQPAFEAKIDRLVTLAVDRSCGRMRHLHTRHCSDAALRHVAAGCPNLVHLALISCPNITDLLACEVAAACPQLKYLDLSECQQITCISLQQFGLYCKHLILIKRNMVNKFSDVRASIIPDKFLVALASVNADTEAIALSSLLPQLKGVTMRYSQLTDQGLTALVKGCPRLEYLDFLGSSRLTRSALDNAGESLKNLKEFIRPRLPSPNHRDGTRHSHWLLSDFAYRRVHVPYSPYFPVPRIMFAYIPHDTERN